MILEKRKFVRVPSLAKIKVKIIEPKELAKIKLARLKNLSGGGLLFLSEEEIPIKTILTLSFDLAAAIDSLILLAEVVRSKKIDKGYETAVKFLKKDDKDIYVIFDYIVRKILENNHNE